MSPVTDLLNPTEIFIENGVRIAFVPYYEVEFSTIVTIVNAGPKYDSIDKAGLSHFIEHLKLHPSRQAKNLIRNIEPYATRPSGFSYMDTTRYWLEIINKHVVQGIEYIVYLLTNSEFTDEAISAEKGKILEEIRISLDNPQRGIWQLWHDTVFAGTELGKPAIGNHKTVNGFTREDISSFVADHYTPSNISFIIVGDLPSQLKTNILETIKKAFNRKKYTYHVSPKKKLVLDTKKGVMVKKTPHSNSLTVMLGFRTSSIEKQEFYLFSLVKTYLYSGFEGPLDKRLFWSKLVYSLDLFNFHFQDTGYFAFKLSCKKQDLHTILEIIYQELNKLKKGIIDKERFEWAKHKYINQLKLRLNSPLRVAEYYSNQLPFGKHKLLSPITSFSKVNSTSAKEIQNTAKIYFISERLKLSIIGNIESKEISHRIFSAMNNDA